MVRPDSGINTFADLKGKTIIGDQLGSELAPVMWSATLAGVGLTDKDVTLLPHSGSSKELTAAIREKRADGATWFVTPASAWVQELFLTGEAQFISMTDEEVFLALDDLPCRDLLAARLACAPELRKVRLELDGKKRCRGAAPNARALRSRSPNRRPSARATLILAAS